MLKFRGIYDYFYFRFYGIYRGRWLDVFFLYLEEIIFIYFRIELRENSCLESFGFWLINFGRENGFWEEKLRFTCLSFRFICKISFVSSLFFLEVFLYYICFI